MSLLARRRVDSIIVVALAVLSLPLAASQIPRALDIAVTHRARALHPGEAVLIELTVSAPLASITGRAFERPLRFFPGDHPEVWRALIGIDLDTKPGRYVVGLTAAGAGTDPVTHSYALNVEPKSFPTRQLTVAPAFVNPPADQIDRIQREAARLAEIFRTATAERLWNGPFLAPVPGQATSSFGSRSVFNGQPRSPHTGADFRAGEGTPIKAPNAGRVVLSDEYYFSGNVVILDHGWGLYSFFAHLSKRLVEEGDAVAAGQIVGHVGATGRVTGPHLHWTVRLDNALVDPVSLMTIVD